MRDASKKRSICSTINLRARLDARLRVGGASENKLSSRIFARETAAGVRLFRLTN